MICNCEEGAWRPNIQHNNNNDNNTRILINTNYNNKNNNNAFVPFAV